MLEPRRLAAQAAAAWMARALGEETGKTVGFRIRGESRVSSSTRIEVVTEGILTRMLQDDPALADAGMLIFDEFHERSVHAELGLALALESQASLRGDLRILVMSATLDVEPLRELLGGAPFISCPGRSFPVEVRYAAPRQERIEARIEAAVAASLRDNPGDVLVFLPGRAEILRCEERLRPLKERDVLVLPLSSEVGTEGQQRALSPAPAGMRKVILATSIAETSLTIEGVRVVIDSGLMRVPRFDSARAMSGLETVAVSMASAEQRAGRAGRRAPGVCYRLWPASDDASLAKHTAPEMLHSDMVPLALELAVWGCRNPRELKFLDPPPHAAFAQARALLTELGALEAGGAVTPHGREMARLGVHPRLAHMLIAGKTRGFGTTACYLAALLEERDMLLGKETDVDISQRLQLLAGREARGGLTARITQQAARLCKMLGVALQPIALEHTGVLTALAYPDRIAQRRAAGGRRYLLAGGSGAELPQRSLLTREQYLAVAHLDGAGANARIFLAEPVSEEEIRAAAGAAIREEKGPVWENNQAQLLSRERLGAIVLRERREKISDEEAVPFLLDAVRERGLGVLAWDSGAGDFRARAEWLRRTGLAPQGWPELGDKRLLETLDGWLAPFLPGKRSLEQLRSVDLRQVLAAQFSYDQLRLLDRAAPEAVDLPSGTRARIDYESGEIPKIAVRLQEMFGQAETPRVGDGRIALTVELLSPAHRPLQLTRDLTSFWKNAYLQVRKEMQGRYPKHSWPEDPLSAQPTRRPKRRA
jgi:ATP-dependent helicase HrpB